MGKKLLHMALAVIAAVLPTIPSMAQIPEGYYNSLKGKKGAELKLLSIMSSRTPRCSPTEVKATITLGGDFGSPTEIAVATSSTDTQQKASG